MSPPVRLSALFVYPVKSLRGVGVASLSVADGRVVGDRLWMLVDGAGRFMHQRDHPQMARVEVHLTREAITLKRPDGDELVLGAEPPGAAAPVEHVRMWRRAAAVAGVDREADAWCTEALGVSCRLVRFAPTAPGIDVPPSERDASLQDATPFHLTSEDSLADLNGRMDRSIPMIRFRPNLVVSGAAAYAEDLWKTFRIGGLGFEWVKPCTRCVLTTTDHLTGVRESTEPLRTLATYRRWGREVVFGHYYTADGGTGTLSVGDVVDV